MIAPARHHYDYVRQQIELLRTTHPDLWEEGDDQLLADMLEGATELNELLTKIVRHKREAEANAAGARADAAQYADPLYSRAERYDKRVEAMRELALSLMQFADVKRIELPIATLSIHAGSQKVIITDEAALPEDCWRVSREPNKTVIKERLAAGEALPGAAMSNAEPYLNMRTK